MLILFLIFPLLMLLLIKVVIWRAYAKVKHHSLSALQGSPERKHKSTTYLYCKVTITESCKCANTSFRGMHTNVTAVFWKTSEDFSLSQATKNICTKHHQREQFFPVSENQIQFAVLIQAIPVQKTELSRNLFFSALHLWNQQLHLNEWAF